jgi:hypothetical protein
MDGWDRLWTILITAAVTFLATVTLMVYLFVLPALRDIRDWRE